MYLYTAVALMVKFSDILCILAAKKNESDILFLIIMTDIMI